MTLDRSYHDAVSIGSGFADGHGLIGSAAANACGSLLVSIHDVGPRFEGEVDQLRDLLAQRLDVAKVALLVVPDHWGVAPILPGSSFARRLRSWVDGGAEVLLHGWLHRDTARYTSALDRFRARHLTAGEGEFLGLSRAEALARLIRGRRLLEDVTGRSIDGFVAPAWLYGAGARLALADAGFRLAEDHMRVWDPLTGRSLARGPVLTWASRSRARIVSSLMAARLLLPVQRRQRTARIGVHPGDVHQAVLLRSIERSVDCLLRTHRPGRYADLLQAREGYV